MGGRSRVLKIGSSTSYVVSAIRLHPLLSLLQLGMVQEEQLITLKTNINSQLKGQLLRNVLLQKLL
jgi:preprotein translocase subunit Sec63